MSTNSITTREFLATVIDANISDAVTSKAQSLLMQRLATPNTHLDVLYPMGLSHDSKYHIENRQLSYSIKVMGGLINTAVPFHVRPDGFIHGVIARFVRMNYEKESHDMYGDAMMFAGVHLKPRFAALGNSDNIRLFQDFASRLYEIRKTD